MKLHKFCKVVTEEIRKNLPVDEKRIKRIHDICVLAMEVAGQLAWLVPEDNIEEVIDTILDDLYLEGSYTADYMKQLREFGLKLLRCEQLD